MRADLASGDSLYSATNLNLLHHVHAALKAHVICSTRDVDYMVANRARLSSSMNTPGGPCRAALVGRHAPGHRGQGGVAIQNESQTLASTTFQNYFRLYDRSWRA